MTNDKDDNTNNTTMDSTAATTARKRKADALSRVAGAGTIGKGRGSMAGWTSCPLCGDVSKKKYSIGRGIASHLEAIHTPWKPSKLALKIQRRVREREARRRLQQQENNQQQDESSSPKAEDDMIRTEPWEPTQQEVNEWNQQILEICKETEENAAREDDDGDNTTTEPSLLDRTGNPVKKYKESLPPFLEAASKGYLQSLRRIVEEATKEMKGDGIISTSSAIAALLNTKDRHMSTADHWAAGSGSLECLKYILELRRKHTTTTCTADLDETVSIKKPRRRDGKTCLHYAARNGHLECVRYLLEDYLAEEDFKADEVSGEGSTPLHMACYGGHPKVVRYLVSKGADPGKTNEWGCTSAHWVAMTISPSTADVRELCTYLFKKHGVSFAEAQNQGHTALHKAAHRRNEHVIRWLADDDDNEGGAVLSESDKKKVGQPDLGGHKPSAIWRSVGGKSEFGDWMESLGW
jgi:hypothetical protein